MAPFSEISDGASAISESTPLTIISSAAREVGRSAAARLLQRIGDGDLPPQDVILPPQLIKRGSA